MRKKLMMKNQKKKKIIITIFICNTTKFSLCFTIQYLSTNRAFYINFFDCTLKINFGNALVRVATFVV